MTAHANTKELATNRPMVLALLLSMVAMAVSLMTPTRSDASAFPGANSKIVFESTRTTGIGVNNPEGDAEIFTMNPDGSNIEQLTTNKASDANPSYSADGKRIVFDSNRTGNSEVFGMNADGTGQTNLTKNAASDGRPSFSPNGKKIAFDSNRGAIQDNIFVMNADGTTPTKLTTNLAADFNATFSPKGNKIAFVSDRGGGDTELFAMNPDGTAETPLTQNDVKDEDPSFSPDAGKIAFASNRDGLNPSDFDVFQMNPDGSSPLRFTSSSARDDLPAFSPDGKKIAYTSTQNGGDRDVLLINSDSNPSGPTDLTANSDTDEAPDWQPISTFTVTTTADTNDGVCDSNCTLREAINASNSFQARSKARIEFDIPGTGVHTIFPSALLPAITNPVVVDGYTQPGASPNTLAQGTNAKPEIVLNGASGVFSSGLEVQGSNSVIRGLVIDNFGTGILVFGFPGHPADNNRIEGNFIGTDPTGTLDKGNGLGVRLNGGTGNVVGGTTPSARNLISGNSEGVELSAGEKDGRILGNLVGTTANGTSPLGNDFLGVAMVNDSTSGNDIGNGTAAGANTIALNGEDGVEIDFKASETGNTISRNSIFSNGGLGIDLIGNGETSATNVSTANDADNPNTPEVDPDGDAGPNNLQNFPVITSARNTTTTTIAGKLNSTPGKTYAIQFFSDPSGDEGKKFIGEKSVTTDASGSASFTFSPASKVAAGQNVTATATKTSTGDTSEFSAPRIVALATGSNLSPETTKVSGPSGVTTNPTAHFAFTSPDPDATFECSPDGGAYYGCSSPENINRLPAGRHTFGVRAVDGQGNLDSSPAVWIWAVERNK